MCGHLASLAAKFTLKDKCPVNLYVSILVSFSFIFHVCISISSVKSDVWSFGITCCEVYTQGQMPYLGKKNAQIVALLRSGT